MLRLPEPCMQPHFHSTPNGKAAFVAAILPRWVPIPAISVIYTTFRMEVEGIWLVVFQEIARNPDDDSLICPLQTKAMKSCP